MTTMAIGVPTGIKIFNWLATLWGGRIHFKTPMLFCLAFLFQFLVAGLTGIMLSAAPFDWQLGNSYFVVAHFHYVIVGGILFAVFGAFYYWFPKMSGKMYSETLGRLHFVLFLIGFHLTFDFMHIPGLLGMPRRIYTYEPGRGWDIWNLIVTAGVAFQGAAILVFVGIKMCLPGIVELIGHFTSFQVVMSQSLIMPFWEAVASCLPSGLSIESLSLSCSSSSLMTVAVSTSQTLMR
jgi:cytochrome c oxidase subunit 1